METVQSPDRPTPEAPAAATRHRPAVTTAAVAADVVGVLVFVLAGRRAHAGGSGTAEAVVGALGTAWPYLVGLAVGWALTRAWRRPAALRPTGLGVWASTVVLGTVLRGLSGGGLATSFLVVSTTALAVLLLGWRAVAAGVRAARR